MGKNFEKELEKLGDIYRAAFCADIDVLVNFLEKHKYSPIFTIGSGGSYTVASIFEFFHTVFGGYAKRLTPIEISQYQKQIKSAASVLFTAGGRNKDSLETYRYISELEPEGILTCCMRLNAPIKRIQRDNLHNSFFEYMMPVKKDGYLAVESIVSNIVILARAYEKITHNVFFHLDEEIENTTSELFLVDQIKQICEKDTIIVLHGGLTTPAAIDLESKFSEVALGNIQLVDFRNFAHGRHFWLTERHASTGIIAMESCSESQICQKTLELVPQNIPIIHFETKNENAYGLLEAFNFVFHLVLAVGHERNINPGKPSVSDFGKKMYHLKNDLCNKEIMKNHRKNPIAMAAYRKECALLNMIKCDELAQHNYLVLKSKLFSGIVFDYDGTIYLKAANEALQKRIFEKIVFLLENNIQIAVATGRGKSVRVALQERIPPQYWNKVVIAYYNGGCIGLLSDDTQPNKKILSLPYCFIDVVAVINDDPCLKEQVSIDKDWMNNPYQLTVTTKGNVDNIHKRITSLCSNIEGIKIIKSSHSVDIVQKNVSKNSIFDYFSSKNMSREDFLCIGDSGEFGGNDYELLNNINSISVDNISDNPNVCWNFSFPGMRNLEATLYYLERIHVQFDKFSIGV